jgi:hypothetical protein
VKLLCAAAQQLATREGGFVALILQAPFAQQREGLRGRRELERGNREREGVAPRCA